MWSLGTLLFISAFVASHVIIDDDEPTSGVLWPTEYYLQGNEYDVVQGRIKTFEIWYSAERNRSRVSYYGGVDTTYYYGETDNDTGREYRVYYKTTRDLEKNKTCSNEFGGEALDFLPSVEDFTYSGEKQYNKKTVKVWQLHKDEDDDVEENILYVYRDDTNDIDIPLRLETKTYWNWTQSLKTHSITEYYNYKYPETSDMEVPNVDDCEYGDIETDHKKTLEIYHPDIGAELDKVFQTYKQTHKQQYKKDEHEMRKRIFQNNWRKVMEHNKKNSSYKMEVNRFSDRTPEELKYLSATISKPLGKGSIEFPYSEDELKIMAEQLPENYDMRLDGIIGRVKNQGSCGSCWAFSTTAAVEGAVAKSNGGRIIDLSEQSLVDCAWGFGNFGCGGGIMEHAFKYIVEHGIPTERKYGPYLEQNGNCTLKDMEKVYKIKNFVRVPALSVNAMKVALYYHGPVSVAIYASDNILQYSSGILYDIECIPEGYINHAVTVVGYGVREGTPYWIVRNSWGEEWGQDGYVLLSAQNDNCLLLTQAYYPII